MKRTPSRVRALLLAAIAAAVALPALAFATPNHASHHAEVGPLRDLGALPEPAAKSDRKYPGAIAYVDAPSRRMYYVYSDPNDVAHVVTYDLRPEIPQPIATGVLGPALQMPSRLNPYVVAYDSKRHHLIFRGLNINANGQMVQSFTTTFLVYDTVTNKALPEWHLPAKLPGFEPAGITYSRQDDLLYMVGDYSADWLVNAVSADVVNPVASVVAVDPTSGDVVWIKPIPQCQKVLNNPSSGGPLFHSDDQPALYFVCVTGSGLATVPYPQSGLVRLTVDPKARSAAAAANFPIEFFPISGQYYNGGEYGVAAFDHKTDRFFLQSMAIRTPGDWVFDGRRSAWVGFVPAPDYSDSNIGYNEGLGRLYIGLYRVAGDPNNGLVIADGRQTPIPAGALNPLTTRAYIATDAATRRMFVLPADAPETLAPYQVINDVSPRTQPLGKFDYDAQTSALPESRASYINYSSDADGFGANVVLVGGTAGPLSVSGNIPIPSPVDAGSRGIRLAQVSGLGIRTAGASASAQAVIGDINTSHDYQTNVDEAGWPYDTASCLDSGGGIKPQRTEYRDTSANVTCDLEHETATGTADATGLTAGAIHIGHADATGAVTRRTKVGSTTAATATSSGIKVDIPSGGSLHIGHVTASLTTSAHGVAGTTTATYSRSIRGVSITDGKGKTVFGPEACGTTITAGNGHRRVHDTCAALADALHPYTQNRLLLTFPMPETTATPLGAYAAVQQRDADFLQERTVNDQGVLYPKDSTALRPAPAAQVEVFNDAGERSRLLAQFAGVQGDSVFTTSGQGHDDGSLPTPGSEPSGNGGKPTDRASEGTGGSGGGAPGDDVTTDTTDEPTTPPAVASAPTGGVAGWLFLHRSLRDALLLASVLALAAGAVLLAIRRQRLLTAMTITTERPSS